MICRTLKRLKLFNEPVAVACAYVCVYVCVRVLSLVWLLHSCRLLTCKTGSAPGCGSPLAVCLYWRSEALLSLSLPDGGISSPTRELVELPGVCVCVCVYLLNCT